MTSTTRFHMTIFLAAVITSTQALGCFDFNFGGPEEGTGGTGGSGGALVEPCNPPVIPGCPLDQECLATASNAGKDQPSFRMVSLDLSAPAALSEGILRDITQQLFVPNDPACFALGAGPTSWLIQLDLGMGTLRTGSAQPGPDDLAGHQFYEQMLPIGGTPRQVGPTTFDLAQDPDGTLRTATKGDLYLRVFTSSDANPQGEPLILPLHDFSMYGVSISGSGNCIGRLSPERYAKDPTCDASSVFSPAGSIDATISLEEADTIIVSELEESLCVVLSGSPTTFGDRGMPYAHCKRTQGVIDFKGDWCAGSGPATASCHDAVRFHGDFAAAAVDVMP